MLEYHVSPGLKRSAGQTVPGTRSDITHVRFFEGFIDRWKKVD